MSLPTYFTYSYVQTLGNTNVNYYETSSSEDSLHLLIREMNHADIDSQTNNQIHKNTLLFKGFLSSVTFGIYSK